MAGISRQRLAQKRYLPREVEKLPLFTNVFESFVSAQMAIDLVIEQAVEILRERGLQRLLPEYLLLGLVIWLFEVVKVESYATDRLLFEVSALHEEEEP